jgi:hypothetical protein
MKLRVHLYLAHSRHFRDHKPAGVPAVEGSAPNLLQSAPQIRPGMVGGYIHLSPPPSARGAMLQQSTAAINPHTTARHFM